MKTLKRNRLRMLVARDSITQQQANQLWREYQHGTIPMGKIKQTGWQYSIRVRITESEG